MEENNNPVNGAESTEDLLAKLDQATEKKEVSKSNNSGWNFDGDTTEPAKPSPNDFEQEPETTPKTGEPAPEAKPEPKLTKQMKEATARITVSALDSTQRVIFTPLINRKYAKKFTDREVKDLDEKNIIDEEKSNLSQQDLPLRNKFDRLMKKRDKKIAAIPFTETESSDLQTIFVQYMDAKNQSLPPELMLFISVGNVLGKRAIDLFTE